MADIPTRLRISLDSVAREQERETEMQNNVTNLSLNVVEMSQCHRIICAIGAAEHTSAESVL